MNGRLRAFCHNCGADIVADEPIILDNWAMTGIGYPLCYKGSPLRLTPAEAELCWSLLKAFPDPVNATTLLDRIGSDGYHNTLTVLICRIRTKMSDWEIPNPIATIRRHGYRWNPGVIHGLFPNTDSDASTPLASAVPVPTIPLG